VIGLSQGAKAPPSSWQTNVAVESPSVNAKVAVVEFVRLAGVCVSVGGGGGVRSTVQV
jgi:hypothetical protein